MNTDNLKKEIKKVKVWHIALLCTGIFLAFAIIGSILLAAGSVHNIGNTSFSWGNIFHLGNFSNFGVGKMFEVNDRSEQDLDGVDNIVIGTVSDNVILQSGGSKAVAELKGQCRSVTKPVWLETHKDGSTLYIEVKYPQTISNTNTELTVTIPAEYMGSLTIGAVSGSIEAEGLPFKLQQVTLGTVSGDVNFNTTSFTRLKAGTISGSATISNILAETNVNTVSGGINLDYASIAATTVVTVSGGVDASIPENAVFKVDFGTVSGEFHSTHPGLNISSADHGFTGSTPGATELIKVNTTSGNFKIQGK